jgi:hypothetical protein
MKKRHPSTWITKMVLMFGIAAMLVGVVIKSEYFTIVGYFNLILAAIYRVQDILQGYDS